MSELRGDGLQAFAPYVFGRLLREGRQAELLDLPLQFDDALHAWLSAAGSEDAGSRQQLLWLHEIRMQEYGACAATLGRLMQAHGPQPRLVALQKLAALTAAL